MFPVAMKLSARHLPYIHRLQLTINQFMVLPAVVIVAATGIYQMDKGHWDYGDLWVSATITILVVVALINIFFFIPTDRRLLPIARRRWRTPVNASFSWRICRRPTSAGDARRVSSVRSWGSC